MKLHVLMKHCNCCVHLWLDFHGAYCAIYTRGRLTGPTNKPQEKQTGELQPPIHAWTIS